MTASKEQLQKLHEKLASVLAKRIDSGEATAAELNVARQLLKDNNIEAIAVPGSPLDRVRAAVTDTLPFAGANVVPITGT